MPTYLTLPICVTVTVTVAGPLGLDSFVLICLFGRVGTPGYFQKAGLQDRRMDRDTKPVGPPSVEQSGSMKLQAALCVLHAARVTVR